MTKYTLQDKIAHLESFATSGLKRIEYAALHNINFNSFKCWPYFVKQALLAQSTEQLVDSVDASSSPNTQNKDEKDVIDAIYMCRQKTPKIDIVPVNIMTSAVPPNPSSGPAVPILSSDMKNEHSVMLAYKEPPPDVTVILPSGVQVKCDIELLNRVMELVS